MKEAKKLLHCCFVELMSELPDLSDDLRADDQRISFTLSCGSVDSKLQSFTSVVQCHILNGTLELKVFPLLFFKCCLRIKQTYSNKVFHSATRKKTCVQVLLIFSSSGHLHAPWGQDSLKHGLIETSTGINT